MSLLPKSHQRAQDSVSSFVVSHQFLLLLRHDGILDRCKHEQHTGQQPALHDALTGAAFFSRPMEMRSSALKMSSESISSSTVSPVHTLPHFFHTAKMLARNAAKIPLCSIWLPGWHLRGPVLLLTTTAACSIKVGRTWKHHAGHWQYSGST